jgi:pimeloyl-ACP methyl ester carboxylesterase
VERTYRIKSDEIELAVETFGQGPLLVFAHGLSGNRVDNRRQLTPLASDYHIVIFDQRGHGDSTPITDPALYDAELMAGDMAAIMDALGIERANVGGTSMGAATALLFALKWPKRVSTLLLVAPAFGDLPNPDRERLKDAGNVIATQGIDAYLVQYAERLRTELGAPDDVIAELIQVRRSHDPASLAAACRTVADWVILSDLSSLADLHVPVCVVAWENDPVHPIELARRLVAALPDAHLEETPSALDRYTDPGLIARIYLRFLEEMAERNAD